MTNPLLLPVVAAQGLWVRRRIEVLPEAAGPTSGMSTSGVTPASSRDGEPLRLVVVGESTAAGCGAPTHDDGFTGAFARALAEQRERPVAWSVHARFGATIRRVRHRMVPSVAPDADVVVVLVGVNDVLNATAVQGWADDLGGALDALADGARIVVLGIPPFGVFPSLPRVLRNYLAERGRLLDAAAQAVCQARPRTTWVSSADLAPVEREFFARDGFHPSPAGYRRWAEYAVDHVPGDARP